MIVGEQRQGLWEVSAKGLEAAVQLVAQRSTSAVLKYNILQSEIQRRPT